MNIYTIIVAAGKGERVGFNTPKQYLELNNKKLLYYSLNKFTKVDSIKKTFVALSKNDQFFDKEDYSDLSNFEILLCGGKERSHTIHNALKKINAEKELEHIKDDLEAIILRPYSSRAKNVRAEIKLKYE